MAKKIPREINPIIQRVFPEYQLSDGRCPQGQNNYCFNFLLKRDGNVFLLKAIRLRSTKISDTAAVLDEVKAVKAIRSQYSIRLIDVKEDSGYAFLLFPFIDGTNLAEFLHAKGRPLNEDEIKDIGINLLRGVADLSRFGVQHQDIKPENILITSDGNLKILDFGSARFRKPSFRGSTNTNKIHSSPEQLLASKPSNLERLRLTCDERSDVYSVGSVLYFITTGHAPFRSNEEKMGVASPPIIERTDISEGLKRIINRTLNFHMRNRPRATTAVGYIESGDVHPQEIKRGGLYYNSSTSLKRLKDVLGVDSESYNGIIVDASKYPNSDKEYINSGSLRVIVDPQTYLFQTPKLINSKFKHLPYFHYAQSPTEISVDNITDKDGLVNSVFDYEISAGTDFLVPPFFLIKEFNDDSWTLDADITGNALNIYSLRNLQLPLLKGVAISENLLQSDVSRGSLIDHLTNTDWLQTISGYFVLVECSQPEGYPNESWLKSVKDLFTNLLSTGKVVYWSHAYLPALLFSHSGVSLGMGEAMSQKSFHLNEDASTIKITSPHIYLPKIFARIKWPTGINALNAHHYSRINELFCVDRCCNGIDFTNPATRGGRELAIHTLLQISKQFRKYSSVGGSTSEKEDLKEAQKIYKDFRTDPDQIFRKAIRIELKPNSGGFLDQVMSAFHPS